MGESDEAAGPPGGAGVSGWSACGGEVLKAQKKSLEQEFAKTEEYALPKGTPAEEAAELVASLKAREDLSEVRQPKAGR